MKCARDAFNPRLIVCRDSEKDTASFLCPPTQLGFVGKGGMFGIEETIISCGQGVRGPPQTLGEYIDDYLPAIASPIISVPFAIALGLVVGFSLGRKRRGRST